MKKALFVLLLTGCVSKDVALEYARKAHPECKNHAVTAHRLSGTSKTNVEMTCKDANGEPMRRAIAIKCEYGWGFVSDTTCHENN